MSALDAHFQAQESEVARDREIARVLDCPPKDYYAILQINPLSEQEQTNLGATLRKIYRKKSLQIHPDKVKNQDAPLAFDLLKKANLVLATEKPSEPEHASGPTEDNNDDGKGQLEEKQRYTEKTNLLSIYKQVADGIGASIEEDYNHPTNKDIREKVRLVLEQHERDQVVESTYAQRQELKKQSDFKTAAKERELKKSWESRWEQDRDTRVKSWRNFSNKVEKPKKKKKVLA